MGTDAEPQQREHAGHWQRVGRGQRQGHGECASWGCRWGRGQRCRSSAGWRWYRGVGEQPEQRPQRAPLRAAPQTHWGLLPCAGRSPGLRRAGGGRECPPHVREGPVHVRTHDRAGPKGQAARGPGGWPYLNQRPAVLGLGPAVPCRQGQRDVPESHHFARRSPPRPPPGPIGSVVPPHPAKQPPAQAPQRHSPLHHPATPRTPQAPQNRCHRRSPVAHRWCQQRRPAGIPRGSR